MKQQKPIIHGRDHGCGGADPVPGICETLIMIDQLKAAGLANDYASQQVGVFHVDPGGPTAIFPIGGWPEITIPMDEFNEQRTIGRGLLGNWTAKVQGRIDEIVVYSPDIGSALIDTPSDGTHPVGDDGWIICGKNGWVLVGGGGTTVTHDVVVSMQYEQSSIFFPGDIKEGIFTLSWLKADEFGSDSLYPGGYPLMNADVASNAAINPAKLEHPGGSTSFLRADGTWSSLTLQVEF